MRLIPLIFLILLTGCAEEKSQRVPHHEPGQEYQGDLIQLLDDLYNTKLDRSLDQKCDLDIKDGKYAVAKFLEENRLKIKEFVEQKPAANKCKDKTDLGLFQVLNCQAATSATGDWKKYENWSWSGLLSAYANLDKEKVDDRWVRLNSGFRQTMFSERNRIKHWVNFSIEPFDLWRLYTLEKLALDCEEKSCNAITFDLATRDWMLSKDYYAFHFNNLKKYEGQPDNYAKALESFLSRIRSDLDMREPFEIEQVELSDKGVLRVDMHFEKIQSTQQLKKYFEDFWSQHGLKIAVVWHPKDDIENLNPVRLLAGPLGSRAYFRNFEDDQHVSVPEEVSAKILSHEFGHVLGLPDNYYEQFDKKECKYFSWFKDADIMSASSSGRVLVEHAKSILTVHGP